LAKKILYLIAGAVGIILGIMALFDGTIAILLSGIMFLIYGAGDLVQWIGGRKSGTSSIWQLLGAILSFVLGGCMLLGNLSAQTFSAAILVLFFAIWLMTSGVFEILGAVMYRKAMTSEDLGVQAPGSKTAIVSGGIMIGVGLLVLISPNFAAFTVHIWIAVGLMISGVRLIASARSVGELEEAN